MNNTMKLVAECRQNAETFERSDFIGDNVTGNAFRQAADTIESLQARVKCLEEALGEAVSAMEPLGYYFELNDQRDGTLEVPVRELRAILWATIAARTTLANQGGEAIAQNPSSGKEG